ncbi:hypothetical protein [Corynebacterium terpenotabidum]|uniref:DUF4439 domain-containing protein n=1 Tax=Corynebacterium terpenotabidum Y-11 TaxID=1200352 RepID=S4XH40_9CORY|nr:hypothetical protein [Corynebacterium terpenotabidum]AGP30970.1 hypothetical protein A606_06615 [Corynebacterium terpenotabidum Y-11]
MHATSRPGLTRRSFLTRTLVLGLGLATLPAAGALTACSSEDPEPDARLLELVGTLRALETSPVDAGSGIFAAQADLVSGEIVRQCGTENPESCTATLDTVVVPADTPTVATARDQMTAVLPDAADSDQAALLAGLFAALATVADTDAGAPAIDWTVVETPLGSEDSTRRKTAASALEEATSRIHEAVWLTGRVLPTAGTPATAVTTVAGRLRQLRDVSMAVTDVPAAVGYTFPDGTAAPTDAASSATVLLTAVHAVTVELRRAVGSVDAEDRATVAMWCAVSARCEAALEDQLGINPLSVAVRGE